MNKLPYKECEECKDWNGSIGNCSMICTKPYDALHELEQYRAIGTVEECREAVSKAKKMKTEPFCKYAEDIKICPRCGEILSSYRKKYCHRCGQTILWEE